MHKFITALLFLTVFCAGGVHSRQDAGHSVAVTRALPTVLEVTTSRPNEAGITEVSGFGSSVVIDHRGYLVTCWHVVAGEESFTVNVDGTAFAGWVVAHDEALDLALIKVDHEFTSVATWGDSSTLLPGDFAFAIGYPFDIAELSSFGYISQTQWLLEGHACLVTDASINPGNSGGGLFDSHGQLIGLPARTYAAGGIPRNINIAIPGNVARAFVQGNLP